VSSGKRVAATKTDWEKEREDNRVPSEKGWFGFYVTGRKRKKVEKGCGDIISELYSKYERGPSPKTGERKLF